MDISLLVRLVVIPVVNIVSCACVVICSVTPAPVFWLSGRCNVYHAHAGGCTFCACGVKICALPRASPIYCGATDQSIVQLVKRCIPVSEVRNHHVGVSLEWNSIFFLLILLGDSLGGTCTAQKGPGKELEALVSASEDQREVAWDCR